MARHGYLHAVGGEVVVGQAAAFEEAVPALWEADFSGVRALLEAWRPGGRGGRWPP
ncbi:MAG: hypothetical protein HY906_23900 [Deltaproteobacteria bacterium]|nr:hypothetical protein [Deltaproteobacteria bacterium]